MITLNQVIPPLSIDVSDAVEMRIIPTIDLADDTPIGESFVRHDGRGPVQSDALNRSIQKDLGCFCIPPCRQAENGGVSTGIYATWTTSKHTMSPMLEISATVPSPLTAIFTGR